jgi:hypothetical protein
LAQRLSDRNLKNASTRIFNDPLRSFLELVINALDASQSTGLSSSLSFLDHPETEGCIIHLETTAKDEVGLTSYTMGLFKANETPHVLFTFKHLSSLLKTCLLTREMILSPERPLFLQRGLIK